MDRRFKCSTMECLTARKLECHPRDYDAAVTDLYYINRHAVRRFNSSVWISLYCHPRRRNKEIFGAQNKRQPQYMEKDQEFGLPLWTVTSSTLESSTTDHWEISRPTITLSTKFIS